ncbi:hypothetical protein ACROYT_G039412 [Oculina patagonica]
MSTTIYGSTVMRQGIPNPKSVGVKEEQNGDKLDKDRFIQHPNGTLQIKNVRLEDQGRYYCIAANHAEMKWSKFSLVVQKRSLCALRRLKTYLNSTMGQQRVRNIALINIERAYAKSVVNHEKIVSLKSSAIEMADNYSVFKVIYELI